VSPNLLFVAFSRWPHDVAALSGHAGKSSGNISPDIECIFPNLFHACGFGLPSYSSPIEMGRHHLFSVNWTGFRQVEMNCSNHSSSSCRSTKIKSCAYRNYNIAAWLIAVEFLRRACDRTPCVDPIPTHLLRQCRQHGKNGGNDLKSAATRASAIAANAKPTPSTLFFQFCSSREPKCISLDVNRINRIFKMQLRIVA